MRLMHTKLPEFIKRMKAAVTQGTRIKPINIRGLESIRSAKLQSLRTGRIEAAVREMAGRDEIERIEMVVMPRVPETMHTVVVKGIDKEGKTKEAILEVINILHPTEEVELDGCNNIDDRRPPLGKH